MRPILVDGPRPHALGRRHAAGFQDRDGARPVLGPPRPRFMRLRTVVADAIHDGAIAERAAVPRPRNRLRLEVDVKGPGAEEFQFIPSRRRVDRTFACDSP